MMQWGTLRERLLARHIPGPGVWLACLVLVAVLALPTPDNLPLAGHRVLAILAFAVTLWLTQAVSYEVSAVMIVALIAFGVGLSPSLSQPDQMMGTSAALKLAMSGFTSGGTVLVAAALFISVAMTLTGLDKRIAMLILSWIGVGYGRILISTLLVTVVLSLFVPSATARVACVVPIMMGMIAAFGEERDSPFAAGVMIMVAQATSVWNVGIQTAGAQNLLTTSFIQRVSGESLDWLTWFVAGAPWSLIMSVVLFFVVRWAMPAHAHGIEGGRERLKAQLAELGPMSRNEKMLLWVVLGLLVMWATGGKLHPFDTASVTVVGLAVLLLPGIGVMDWKQVQSRIPWGTLVVFGVGISLGSALLATQAGQWLGNTVVQGLGLDDVAPFWLLAALSLFLIVIHLGFASATALTSTMMPIMLALLVALDQVQNVPGLAMLLGFAISFGFILPINAPQNMVCIGTHTFTSGQFAKVGVPVTLIGYGLMLLMAATWWHWLGLL